MTNADLVLIFSGTEDEAAKVATERGLGNWRYIAGPDDVVEGAEIIVVGSYFSRPDTAEVEARIRDVNGGLLPFPDDLLGPTEYPADEWSEEDRNRDLQRRALHMDHIVTGDPEDLRIARKLREQDPKPPDQS